MHVIDQKNLKFYTYTTCSNRVCHLADQMLNNLELHTENLVISSKHKMCVKIAALCHDLGHGPLSHSWEIFVTRYQPQDKWSVSLYISNKFMNNI